MFQSFLKQHDATAWQRTVEALLPHIHDVDRRATQIWFHFFPLELADAINETADLAQLVLTLRLEGNFRLNAPFLVNETLIEPFGFIGLGWSHYYLSSLQGQIVTVRSDDVGTIPMGAGLAFAYHGFLAEARFTYRPTWGSSGFVLANDGRTFDLDSWNVGAMVGFEF